MFQRELDAKGVCVSVKSACSSDGLPSRAVFAVSRDRRNALSSWRISLSHLTTEEETQRLFAGVRCLLPRADRPHINVKGGTNMKRELEPYQLIERSIIKKYRKELWTPFIVAVKRYELVQAGRQDRRLHLRRQGLHADGKAHAGAAAATAMCPLSWSSS